MARQGGRPWGPIRAESTEARALAEFLRNWVDNSGKTLRTLAAEIHHSRTLIGQNLAGDVPKDEFVAALITATVPEKLRQGQLAEARSLLKAALRPSPATPPPLPASALELAQTRAEQVEVYGRLTRSLEQQNELREAAGNSARLVMVLLSMVNTLERRIVDLAGERDQLRAAQADPEALLQTQRQLARAQEQEQRAQQELERAKEKQCQAEELAARVQEQVDQLNDELERLRTGTAEEITEGEPDDTVDEPPQAAVVADPVGDDIDQALAQAVAVNDQDDQVLRRITDDLYQVPAPDNLLLSGNTADNSRDPHSVAALQDPAALVAALPLMLPGDIHTVITEIAAKRPMRPLRQCVTSLRKADHHTWASQLLLLAGAMRESSMLPLVLGSLADGWADTVLILNGVRSKSAQQVQSTVELLDQLAMREEATYLRLACDVWQSGSAPQEWWFTPRISQAQASAESAPSPPADVPPRTFTALTTRVRINIPGSRPMPPIVLRQPVETAGSDGPQADLA
ncbi:hypothetical protein [Streptomyces geranii]|uniref:hypothetical protein n=1 Tax=Streptomyces geranii TaxID=2058923 RepID=UPI000D040D83|nr:hypothetical protein [Streptomyces geranii]